MEVVQRKIEIIMNQVFSELFSGRRPLLSFLFLISGRLCVPVGVERRIIVLYLPPILIIIEIIQNMHLNQQLIQMK